MGGEQWGGAGGTSKEILAAENQEGFWSAPPISLAGGIKGRAHLVQEEVRLLNLSQWVPEEAEHELLHLEPVNSP